MKTESTTVEIFRKEQMRLFTQLIQQKCRKRRKYNARCNETTNAQTVLNSKLGFYAMNRK